MKLEVDSTASPVLHTYKVHLSTIAYLEVEVTDYNPTRAGKTGVQRAQGFAVVGKDKYGDVVAFDDTAWRIAPCEQCGAAGLHLDPKFQVDYTEVIPEPVAEP